VVLVGWAVLVLGGVSTFDLAGSSKESKPVELLRITPAGDDVAPGRQIVFEFDRPVVPIGRMERRADEIPISIAPKLDCEWRWLNANSLACELKESTALAPATRYEILVEPGIKAEDGSTLQEPVRHTFTTRRPKIEHVRFKSWRSPGTPEILVIFDQEVKQGSVAAHLYLEPEGAGRVGLKVEEDPEIRRARERAAKEKAADGNGDRGFLGMLRDGARKLILILGEATDAEKLDFANRSWLVTPTMELPLDSTVRLQVEPGVLSGKGPEPGVEKRVIVAFDTFPEFHFLGVRCTTNTKTPLKIQPREEGEQGKCNPLGRPALAFSAPVPEEAIRPHLRATPSLSAGAGGEDSGDEISSTVHLARPHRKGDEYLVFLPSVLRAAATYRLQAEGRTITDAFGRSLREDIEIAFTTDHRLPALQLEHPISVLEKNVESHIPVVITNLDAIHLSYETLTVDGREGRKSVSSPAHPARDIAYYFPIKARELIPGGSGAIQGTWDTVPPVEGRRLRSDLARWFFSQVTPFHVHVKMGHHNSVAWVTHLDTGEPVGGAKVRVYTERFGAFTDKPTILADTVTTTDGIAILPGTKILDPDLKLLNAYRTSVPHLVVRIEKERDLALLPLISHFQVDARGANDTYINDWLRPRFGHLRAWGFTAQGVYRVGDTVQFKLYVRDQDNDRFVAPPRKGYSLKVTDPTGKVIHEVTELTLSEFGAYQGEFAVPKTGAVGWYTFQLGSSLTRATWQPMGVLISDFTPAAFRVSTDLNGRIFRPGDRLKVSTQARLHAGGPYVNAQGRVTATVRGTALECSDPAAQGFAFDVHTPGPDTQTLHEAQGSVDAKGFWDVELKVPEARVIYGRLAVESAVRDDRGKYVAGRAGARYVGRDRFVGIRQPDWLLQSGKAAEILTLVADEQGKVAGGTRVTVKVEYRKTRASRVKGAGNAYLAEYVHEWIPAAECTVTSDSKPTRCTFTPDKAGLYRMTATIRDTRGRTHESQTSRWALGAGEVLWETTPGHSLDVIPEKREYRVGEMARFMVQNPYPGARALVTLERFGVQESRVTTLKESVEVIEVPVTARSLPGFYLSVTVMSRRVEKLPPDNQVDLGKPAFRMGYAQVEVKDRAKEVAVEVKPREGVYKPRATATVDLQVATREGAAMPLELAVAVLDEAVFDLIQGGRDYYDPYQGFYRLDPLDLQNFNLLTQLLGIQKFQAKGASAGGDGGAGLTMRSDFRFVTYWNPSVTPDPTGKATITFQVPDNLTGWRVLAVAVSPDDRMGLGEGTFKVNQSTEIRPALPNQVGEGDRFEARFTVMNRTEARRSLTVKMTAEGAIQAANGKETKTLEVQAEPYKRYTVGLPLTAGRAGEIRFTVVASDKLDRDGLQVPLTVRPLHVLEAAATYGSAGAGQVSERVRFPENIRTDVGSLSLTLSPTLVAGLEGAFAYLRDYPYGCWEQILTKGVMAAHYRNLKKYLPESFTWEGSDELPSRTLERASDFQAPNGAMSFYLPRDEYGSPYLSAYTALAFGWLRAEGYAIPGHLEEKLHDYLLALLRRDVFPDFYSAGMASTVRAVALAALAERGKVSVGDLERYRRHVPEMSLFGKAHYLLALTRVQGTEAVQREVLERILGHANETSGKLVLTESLDLPYRRILDSSTRTSGAVLSALVAARGPQAHGGDLPAKLARTIVEARKQRDRWENTQENIFCLNGLIAFSKTFEQENPDLALKVIVDGDILGEARLRDYRDRPQELARPIKPGDSGRTAAVLVKGEGRGRFHYTTRLLYASAALKAEPTNAGIEVRREYSVERRGRWELLRSPMQIKTGELVRVDLFVSLPAARNFVVVDDPVPGGLEPVSRDLATASQADADKARLTHAEGSFWYRFSDWREYGLSFWSFYHRELRHHAARFYSEYLPAGNYHLSYVAQAVAPGEFTVLPVHAEEMYNPETFGRGVPASLVVEATR
jgi:uncharacterized protein YfaS (alpha-2-macroglobulin family)